MEALQAMRVRNNIFQVRHSETARDLFKLKAVNDVMCYKCKVFDMLLNFQLLFDNSN